MQAPTEAELEHAELRTYSLIDQECACTLNAFTTDRGVMDHAQPLIVHILAKAWVEEDLPGLIDEAAIRSRLCRVFAE